MLVVEGGDTLGRAATEQERLKGHTALSAIDAIGYNAMAPGEDEIQLGPSGLKQIGPCRTGFILANLGNNEAGKQSGFEAFAVHKTAGGLRVAVIGLFDPRLLERMPKVPLEVTITDPLEALKLTTPQARKRADFVVVVSHSTKDEAESLARSGLADVVVCTHSESAPILPGEEGNTVNVPIERIGDRILVESRTRLGWSVGRLDITLRSGKITEVSNRLIYLDRTYDESPAIVKLFDDYNAKVKEIALRGQRELKTKIRAVLAERGYGSADRKRECAFIGAVLCKDCHSDAHRKWTESRHSTAFASLEKAGQQFDPDCTPCHTTGARSRGGFLNTKETPELVAVQCEACHGPGKSHTGSPNAAYGKVAGDLCRTCHTDEFNPSFDYEAMWKTIAH